MARWVVNRAVLRLPVVNGEREWDRDASEDRWRQWVSKKPPEAWGEREWRRYRRRFLVYNADEPHEFGSYKLPVVDIVDGKPCVVRQAVIAVQQVLAGARGGVDLPEEVQRRVARVAERLRQKADQLVQ